MNWYHADDEDMSKVTIEKVLDDRTAYLLSYIRIGDDDPLFTAKTPTTVNGNRPKQAPLVSNGPRPPPYSDTRPTTALGHRPTIFANGHSSPIKRKREDEHLSNGDWDSKRQPLSDTVHQAPPYSRDAPSRFSPEHHPSRVFGAGLKPRDSGHPRHQIPESEFYQIQPDPKRQKRGKKKDRDKDKDNRRGSGPPMPFHQGQAPGGGRGGIRAPGMLHRMRGRI